MRRICGTCFQESLLWAEFFVMKKYPLLAIALLLVLIGASLWYKDSEHVVVSYGTPTATEAILVSTPTAATERTTAAAVIASESPALSSYPIMEAAAECEHATLIVEDVSYEPCIDGEESTLALMQQLSTTSDFSFSGVEYASLGFFVETINGKKAEGGYYWFLYVNDTSSSSGASQTLVKAGDVIEWRYKKNY